ncbi:MAG: FGGY family carbohydrate kinase [Gammaproteobacteria bacterium]
MAAEQKLCLALDQGGHASRALVFDGTGQLVATGSVPVETLRNPEGHIEHDPDALIGSLREAIAAACKELPAGSRISAAGLATQRSSLCCWNRHSGEALSPVISWQDRRHAAWLETLGEHAGMIRARTGLVLTPHYGASKMRWCLDHLPAVQAAHAAGELVMGPLASFIACRLLDGLPCHADPANAARTQLWDPATRDWSDELLQLFGIARADLPVPVTSRFAWGELATPLGPVPLTVVTGDQSAVPFAFGPLDAGTAYVNIGTGAFIQRALRDRLPEAQQLLVSVVWSDSDGVDYMLEGTVNGAGSALDWLAAREGLPLARLLDAGQSAAAAGLEPPLFLNGIGGLGSPFWRSDFESRFVGTGTTGSRLLAVLESIAFLLHANYRELAAHGPRFTRLLLTGGLSANDYLCQCLADLCGIPVLRSEEPEATARGLARLIAAEDAYDWTLPATSRLMPAENPALCGRFRRWEELLQAQL